jgi:hypothetical protein
VKPVGERPGLRSEALIQTGRRGNRTPVLRLRRHPLAGLTLLAILTPLLAAGPGMPCSGMDAGRHGENGHVAHATGQNVQSDLQTPAAHAGHAGRVTVPGTDDAPSSPTPASCSMGMMCSGTVLTPAAAQLAQAPDVLALPDAEARWTLHTSDLTLPRRPPRA